MGEACVIWSKPLKQLLSASVQVMTKTGVYCDQDFEGFRSSQDKDQDQGQGQCRARQSQDQDKTDASGTLHNAPLSAVSGSLI